jgi:hypothetical protein
MEKTINFTMTESQAEKFEKLLDDNLEIFERWEKESPNRDADFDRRHEEIMSGLEGLQKKMDKTDEIISKWEIGKDFDEKKD